MDQKKDGWFFQIKSRMISGRGLNLVVATMDKWGCYSLYENFCGPFGPSPGQNIDQFCPPKLLLLPNHLISWDNSRKLKFMFFDSPKLILYANVLLFCNIFCFLGVNWSQKWTKSLHSESKFFLKNLNFSKIVETLFLSAIILHLVKNFTKIGLYLGK